MPRTSGLLVGSLACGLALLFASTADAQTAVRPVAKGAPQRPAIAAAAKVPAKLQPVADFADGWRMAPAPAWVERIDAPLQAPAKQATGPGYRLLLSDVQTWLGAPGEQHQYARSRLVATDASALPEVSKAELSFNPAFQTLTLHEAAIWRDRAY